VIPQETNMSFTETYSNRVRQAQETFTGAAEARLRGAKAIISLVPTPGNGLLSPRDALGQNRRIAKRLVDVNVEYAKDLAGAVRKHMTGLASVVKDEVVTTGKLANEQAAKIEDAAIDQAEELAKAERAAARRAKKASLDAAAERYQDMTKVELSEELASRDLPKTGNVDELRDRLMANDAEIAN
jgi:hypothetical protein